MIDQGSAHRVAAECGLGRVLAFTGPAARGEQGEVFRLETTTGSWAVKRGFGVLDEAAVADGAAFGAAARAAGVPTPPSVRTLDDRLLVRTDDGPLLVYGWVDLLDVDSWLDPVAVGTVVAALHRTTFSGVNGEHPWYTDPVGSDRWRSLAADLTTAGAPFADDLHRLLPEILALEALFEPARDLRYCHRDLFSDNLRRTAEGGLCVVDWDNCGLADPAQELGGLLYDIGCGMPSRAAALYRAYRDAGGPGRLERPGRFTMVIAQLGHINERACARWLAADPGDPERDRMAALFGEFVDRPLTRAWIDETLDALG